MAHLDHVQNHWFELIEAKPKSILFADNYEPRKNFSKKIAS